VSKKGRVTGNSILQNHESQMNLLQNWRSGFLAAGRLLNLFEKCGGLPTAAANPQLKTWK